MCCCVSVQEKQKIYQTHLTVHQRRSEPLDLHFTMDSGLMMDGESATISSFHSDMLFHAVPLESVKFQKRIKVLKTT